MYFPRTLLAVGLCAAIAMPALAMDPKPAAPLAAAPVMGQDGLPRYNTPPQSRQEQIERMKSRVAALEKMSDAEWEAKRKQMKERREQRRAAGAKPGVAKPTMPQPAKAQ